MKKSYSQFISAIVIMMILVMTSCGGAKDKKSELEALKAKYATMGEKIKAIEGELALTDTTKKTRVRDVAVTAVKREVFNHFIDVQGTVDAEENVNVTARTMGTVQRIYVVEGQTVSAGQVLADLESEVYQKQIDALQPQLSFTTDLYNRQKKLWDQKIGSEIQLLTAKSNKEAIEKQIAAMRENMELTKIKSPITGVVDNVGMKLGQGVSSAGPAIRVVNYSKLKVVGDVAEAYASKVSKGNAVRILFPDLNKEATGTISYTSKVIDPLKRTFTAQIEIMGDKSDYRPNMIAVLKIVDYQKEGAIVLPINLIQQQLGEHVVYVAVVEGSKTVAKKRVITTGINYDGMTEVLSGLNENEQLITTGQFDLSDGAEINVQ